MTASVRVGTGRVTERRTWIDFAYLLRNLATCATDGEADRVGHGQLNTHSFGAVWRVSAASRRLYERLKSINPKHASG